MYCQFKDGHLQECTELPEQKECEKFEDYLKHIGCNPLAQYTSGNTEVGFNIECYEYLDGDKWLARMTIDDDPHIIHIGSGEDYVDFLKRSIPNVDEIKVDDLVGCCHQ